MLTARGEVSTPAQSQMTPRRVLSIRSLLTSFGVGPPPDRSAARRAGRGTVLPVPRPAQPRSETGPELHDGALDGHGQASLSLDLAGDGLGGGHSGDPDRGVERSEERRVGQERRDGGGGGRGERTEGEDRR